MLARRADAAGVDRVGVDLEHAGKADRQRGLGTWVSPHTERDLAAVGEALERARLFARVNPVHDRTEAEVEAVVAAGAKVLMLPMVSTAAEAARFVEAVGGRALVVLLVEHEAALRRVGELAAVEGVAEVHVGLNDLALSLGLPNRWLALAGDGVVEAARRVSELGLRFGLGGIGRVDDEGLPIPADLVYAQYARTGATAALLARSFLRPGEGGAELAREVARARARLAEWCARDAASIAFAHEELERRARAASGW